MNRSSFFHHANVHVQPKLTTLYCITSTNLSNNQTRNDAQTPETQQLLEPPLPFLFVLLPLPSASLFPPPFFSLLNCKYQVPFILFCYFYYCYYIVVLVIFFFFFSLVDRRSSGRTVYPQSQSVNTISFQSLVQEGKNRTKCFIFILSPSISLFTTFPFSP